MDHVTISLADLVAKSVKHLDLLGYAESTKNRYKLQWDHFLTYANQKGQNYFSKKLGNEFLKEYNHIRIDNKLSSNEVFKVRAVTILGEILETDSFLMCHQKPGKKVSPQFFNILEKYEFVQAGKKLKRGTICRKKIILVRFLNFLDKKGVTDIKDLTPNEVLSYLHTLKVYKNNSRSGILFVLRDFLSFLYSEGNIKTPLSNLFPVIFTDKSERLPSYYSPDEIHTILCQVDRNSEFGCRDYLVLLLAVQFGMRAGDIRLLKFKNLKWSRDTIEFIQQKTNIPIKLPMTEEFRYALADYTKNSRPEVDDPHIFVRHRAPFQPFSEGNTFYEILNKYMGLATIKTNNRKHGLHSMRHSTASNLLQNNTPYPVITGILGHENTSTTKLYLRIDIQQLRTVALEVPNER